MMAGFFQKPARDPRRGWSPERSSGRTFSGGGSSCAGFASSPAPRGWAWKCGEHDLHITVDADALLHGGAAERGAPRLRYLDQV